MIGYDKIFLVSNILMHKKFCTLLFRIHGGHDNECGHHEVYDVNKCLGRK